MKKLKLAILCFVSFLANQLMAYQLMGEGALSYPNQTEFVASSARTQHPSYRNYTYYVSSQFYNARNATYGLGPALTPITSLHVALVQRAFEILENRSGIDGLNFAYGGTFNVSEFPVDTYKTQYPLSDALIDKKIYIDFQTTLSPFIGGTGHSIPSVSSGNYAGGAHIVINSVVTDQVHPANWRLLKVLLHEILHGLGAGHSSTPSAVMSYNNISYQLISTDDQLALKQIFPDAVSTQISIQGQKNGQNSKSFEAVLVDTVTGRSFVQLTGATGAISTRSIPAGTYWVVGKENNEAASGPCFGEKETGFLTSFYQSNSTSTNNPSSAVAVTLSAGSPVSVVLNLIPGTKNFECSYGSPSVLDNSDFPRTALQLTDMGQEYIRPGRDGFLMFENELGQSSRGLSTKVPVTNTGSGYHSQITVTALGSAPTIKLVNKVSNVAGLDSNYAVTYKTRVPPDAQHGVYAGVCVANGEYALISSMIEVHEFGKFLSYNVELAIEQKDNFSYEYTNSFFHNGIGTAKRKSSMDANAYVVGSFDSQSRSEIPPENSAGLWLLLLSTVLGMLFFKRKSTAALKKGLSFGVLLLLVFVFSCSKKKSDSEAPPAPAFDPGPIDIFTEILFGPWNVGSWASISETNEPQARDYHSAVWTGSEMIIWGGIENIKPFTNSGGKYNPSTDAWSPVSISGAPSSRGYHTAVWTGTEMIIWGGRNLQGGLATGARYNPTTDVWSTLTASNAPTARSHHTAVWTGSKMIVWGGREGGQNLNDGAIYDPITDTWTAMTTSNAPAGRFGHKAVWTGSEMIVFGGDNMTNRLGSGGRFNADTNTWTTLSESGGPGARVGHVMIYGNGKIFVYGGMNDNNYLATGFYYDTSLHTWSSVPVSQYTHPNAYMEGVWANDRFILFGGLVYISSSGSAQVFNSVYSLVPGQSLEQIEHVPNNNSRMSHTAVWTGSQMLTWGGSGQSYILGGHNRLARGARYTK